MDEYQERAKPKEREIPVFTVLKNNCILKNIFVLDNPPSIPSSSSEEFDPESEIEEVLVVGRHPDCNIKLEHPSISRFHLRIHSKPSSRSLFVTDLSSVHGTWVSGRKIEPDIRTRLSEGDTLQLGASSRLYRLNWVPISRAYDLDDPFVPPLNASDTLDEEKEVSIDQDGDSVSNGNNQGKERFSDEDIASYVHMTSPTAPPIPDDFCDDPFSSSCEVEINVSPQIHNRENEPSSSQLCQVDGSVTAEEDTDSVSYGNNQRKGLFADEDIAFSVQTMSPTALPIPEDLYDDPFYKYEVESNIPPETHNRENELSSGQLCQVDASVTIEGETDGVTEDGDCVSDDMEGLEWLFSDEKIAPSSMAENSHHSFPEGNEDNNSSPEICNHEIKHENSTPQGHMSLSVSQTASQGETTEYSEMNSERRLGLSIWSRRGKAKSVKIETSQSRDNCERTNMSSQVKSVLKDDQCASPDNDDKIFTLDKDNTSPNSYLARSLKCKFEETLKGESFSNSLIPNVDQDEFFTPDKENATPDSRRVRPMKSVGRSGKVKCPNSYRPSPLKIVKNENACQDEVFTPDKENVTPDNRLLRSMKSVGRSGEAKCPNSYRPSPFKIASNENVCDDEVLVPKASQHQKVLQELKSKSKSASEVKCRNSYRPSPLKIVNNENMYQEEELFTPDKENVTPDSRLLRSMKRVGRSPLKIAYNENMYDDEVLVPKESQQQKVLQESKSTFSVSGGNGNLKKEQPVLKVRADREPFHPLPIIATSDHKANSRSCSSINYPEPEGINQSYKNTTKVSKSKWTIVADITCLLNRKSRNELQLMRGLRGTTMIIPRIVVRELDCMLRRASFFSRMTEASAALNWIEECLVETKWWIHVQSSAEEGGMVPPTPLAAASHWSSDNKSPFSVGSIPFSPYTLQEIVTPTTADQILESALLFRRTTDAQLVLLSDDVALKIKAMAEGVICETAEEFRKSIVNPFSSRFLYSDSSPIGPTWSCFDDTVLKENYYPSPAKKISKSGEGAKGLKLILLHNSSFRQMSI